MTYWTVERTFDVIYVFSAFSLLGNLAIIATFFMVKDWREKMPSVKRGLLVQCFNETIMNCVLFYDPNGNSQSTGCVIQSIMITIGLTGGALMNGFIAFEMAAICYYMFTNTTKTSIVSNAIKAIGRKGHMGRREIIYYSIFFCFCLFVSIFIPVDNQHGLSAFGGYQCWLWSRDLQLTTYALDWIGIGLSIVCTAYVLHVLGRKLVNKDRFIVGNHATGQEAVVQKAQNVIGYDPTNDLNRQSQLEEQGQKNPIQLQPGLEQVPEKVPRSAMNSQTTTRQNSQQKNAKVGSVKNTIRRLLADIIVYVIFWIPGSIRRFSGDEVSSDALIGWQYFCLTFGFFKFIIWVVFDVKVRQFWMEYFPCQNNNNIKKQHHVPLTPDTIGRGSSEISASARHHDVSEPVNFRSAIPSRSTSNANSLRESEMTMLASSLRDTNVSIQSAPGRSLTPPSTVPSQVRPKSNI
jgi:hypothetical protein